MRKKGKVQKKKRIPPYSIRKKFNLKQQDVANFLGINIKTYQLYEYGKVNIPVNSIIKLADKFNISTDYLLGRTDKLLSFNNFIDLLNTYSELVKNINERIENI